MVYVPRPRLLLVPTVTEVEWKIRPLLEEWADVACYDAPGIGEEPATSLTVEAIVNRGLDEIDRRGWEGCVIVGDEVGAAQATRIAGRRPEAVEGLALGHPARSLSTDGARAPLNADVADALTQLARTDFRSYVRALSQLTQNAYDDELADRYMERVGQETVEGYLGELFGAPGREDLTPILQGLEAPVLLVEHRDCVLWTRESYEDVIAVLPEATRSTLDMKPSVDAGFATMLRDFCATIPAYAE